MALLSVCERSRPPLHRIESNEDEFTTEDHGSIEALEHDNCLDAGRSERLKSGLRDHHLAIAVSQLRDEVHLGMNNNRILSQNWHEPAEKQLLDIREVRGVVDVSKRASVSKYLIGIRVSNTRHTVAIDLTRDALIFGTVTVGSGTVVSVSLRASSGSAPLERP